MSDERVEALEKLGRMYQVFTLVLSDGRKLSLTGPVRLTEEEVDRGIYVSQVIVGPPQPLPEGTTWEQDTDSAK